MFPGFFLCAIAIATFCSVPYHHVACSLACSFVFRLLMIISYGVLSISKIFFWSVAMLFSSSWVQNWLVTATNYGACVFLFLDCEQIRAPYTCTVNAKTLMINLFICLFVSYIKCANRIMHLVLLSAISQIKEHLSRTLSLSYSLLHKPTPIIIHLFIVITIIIVIIMLWKEAKWEKKKCILSCVHWWRCSLSCCKVYAVLLLGRRSFTLAVAVVVVCVQFHCSLAGIFNIQCAARIVVTRWFSVEKSNR